MSFKTMGIGEDLSRYVVSHGTLVDELAHELAEETASRLPDAASMQIALEQVGLMTLLARLVDARYAVEVGTFTGASSLAIARGLAPGGQLVCFDISAEYTAVARRYWERAGVADRVELRLGPAADMLRTLPAEPRVDLAFIDADKVNYPIYWAELVPRMRPGGVIVVDNVLRGGRVLDPESETDKAIADFNDQVIADDRVDVVMLPVADGLTVARRR